ncbi:O-antigen ligase [Pleurocapsa sp. PCC 7319]|uniref:O-antigen ligase family protein n=1 Tax=Pleurocapsa sp. PCC 7319 TaxID=118161 RepID=UPI0003450B2A|nr:O-antigen ligase [Pleurocapsa sp. PCC 7319]
MKKILELIESGFVIVSLMFYSGGVLAVVLSGGISQGDLQQDFDTGLIRLVFSLIYVITFFLLVLMWKKIVYFASRNILFWVLIGLTFASIFWSYVPDVTLRRLVALIGTTMFGIYLSSKYSIEQQLKMLVWTYGIAVFLSFLFVIALPQYGLESGTHEGLWRGIYSHKNTLGVNMATSSIIFWIMAINSQENRHLLWIGFYSSIILVILSGASSALANVFIIIVIYFFCQIFRLRLTIQIPLLICLLITGVWMNILVTSNLDFLLGLLGKDITLTGRTELWQLTWQSIQKEYWLGYGYRAFWTEGNSEASIINTTLSWIVPHAHNGLLQLWTNLGLLGVLIYLAGFLTIFMTAFMQFQQNKQWEFCWIILFLSFVILTNTTEQNLLRENNIVWVLYVATYFSMGLLKKTSKLPRISNDI